MDEFVKEKAAAKRPAFIDGLTAADGPRRHFVRGRQYYNLPDDQAAQARRLVEDYRKRPEAPAGSDDYYAVQDAAGRVAGIGSMGRFRYAALLAGRGTAEARNIILEFKESLPSAYDVCHQREAGPAALKGRAERVIAVERRSQAEKSLCPPFRRPDLRLASREADNRRRLQRSPKHQFFCKHVHSRSLGRARKP